MKKLILTFIIVASSIFANDVVIEEEKIDSFLVKLDKDTEYENELLDYKRPIRLYRNGKLHLGTFKSAYVLNGAELIGEIEFWENGNVKRGRIRNNFTYEKVFDGQVISKFIFKKESFIEYWENGNIKKGVILGGSSSHNLEFKNNEGKLEMNREGYIDKYTNYSDNYILGQHITGEMNFKFNKNKSVYEIEKASAYHPKVLGTVFTGNATSQMPVVIPKNTEFEYKTYKGKDYKIWKVRSNRFQIKSWIFAKVDLYVKDNQIYFIQFFYENMIDGVLYKEGDIVKFNDKEEVERVTF